MSGTAKEMNAGVTTLHGGGSEIHVATTFAGEAVSLTFVDRFPGQPPQSFDRALEPDAAEALALDILARVKALRARKRTDR